MDFFLMITFVLISPKTAHETQVVRVVYKFVLLPHYIGKIGQKQFSEL